jgi:hypothetical protein
LNRIGRRANRRLSHQQERDSHTRNDQCIYASDRDAEKNVGHDLLTLQLGLVLGHRVSRESVDDTGIKQKAGIRSEEMCESVL